MAVPNAPDNWRSTLASAVARGTRGPGMFSMATVRTGMNRMPVARPRSASAQKSTTSGVPGSSPTSSQVA